MFGNGPLTDDVIRMRLDVIRTGRKHGLSWDNIGKALGIATQTAKCFEEQYAHRVENVPPPLPVHRPGKKIAPVQIKAPEHESAETLSDFDRVKRCLDRASRVPARQIAKQTGIPLPIVQEYVKRLGVAA